MPLLEIGNNTGLLRACHGSSVAFLSQCGQSDSVDRDTSVIS